MFTSQTLNEAKHSQLMCLLSESAYHCIFMRLSSCGMNRESTLIHNLTVNSRCSTLYITCYVPKITALACQFVVMRKLPQWHKSHTNKCFIKELQGKMAQVITEEQKTLTIWLAIDCVCYCLRVFGSHRQGSRTGKLNESLGMCLYCCHVLLLFTSNIK